MKIITKNKKAYLDYDIHDKIEAGIVLTGYEVKSIKSGQINLKDAVIKESGSEMYIFNLDIPLYKKTSLAQIGHYQAKGKRKLLLHKRQIAKLTIKTHKTGLILIPLQIYMTKNHRIKVLIGLCKLRRKVQKKHILKERDTKRQMDKQIKNLGL